MSWAASCSPLPVDILGEGGYAVAPPSEAATGRYEFLEGSLADLRHLPVLRLPAHEGRSPAIRQGTRNSELFRIAMHAAPQVDDFDTLLDVVRTHNLDCEPPLRNGEILRIAKSAWGYQMTGRNFAGRGNMTLLSTQVIKQLYQEKQQPALVLLNVLSAYHRQDEKFALAQGMAKSLGWRVTKFLEARNTLEGDGPHTAPAQRRKRPTGPSDLLLASKRFHRDTQY